MRTIKTYRKVGAFYIAQHLIYCLGKSVSKLLKNRC